MNAVILIAHGSKRKSSNDEFTAMARMVECQSPYDYTRAAFLEIESPNIQTVAQELIEQGVDSITLYPYFLNSGKHVIADMPIILKELEEEHPSIKFELLSHFGASAKIPEIILEDISL